MVPQKVIVASGCFYASLICLFPWIRTLNITTFEHQSLPDPQLHMMPIWKLPPNGAIDLGATFLTLAIGVFVTLGLLALNSLRAAPKLTTDTEVLGRAKPVAFIASASKRAVGHWGK